MEIVQDSATDFGRYLGNILAEAFALKLDYTALYGSGTPPEPKGIKPTAGVVTTNFVGVNGGTINSANGDYNAIVDLVGRLRAKNYDVGALLYAPRTGTQLGKLKAATTNEPLSGPQYLDGIKRLETAQIPVNITLGTSNDTSDVFSGDFSKVYIGMRTDFPYRF